MQVEVVGTGYISSNLSKYTKKKANGEEIFVCFFQFANFNYVDPKTRKNMYSYYLCDVMGKYGEIIYNNFIKGQKIFIHGILTNQRYKNKEGKIVSSCIFHLDKVEYMANPKDTNYLEKQETFSNIEEIINDDIIDTIKSDNEIFT